MNMRDWNESTKQANAPKWDLDMSEIQMRTTVALGARGMNDAVLWWNSDGAGNCLVVEVERDETKYALWFGTANETIGASVMDGNGDPADGIEDSYIETYLSSEAPSVTAIAVVIADAVVEWVARQDAWKDGFHKAQGAFFDAACKLSDAWKDGSEFSESYPFGEDFEEVVAKIGKWVAATKAEVK